MKKQGRAKKIAAITLCVLVLFPIVTMPVATVIIYESIFGFRYETPDWQEFSVEEFSGLQMQRSDFYAENGERLAGYFYTSREQAEYKGILVFAHGMGGGGQNGYMPIFHYFASNGYCVFAYDARGNDNSEGTSVEGLPRGVIDLNSAIDHVQSLEQYRHLPMVLMGHSWGAYSVGSVLSLHPEVKAAVLMAGFNESENQLYHQSSRFLGPVVDILIPPVYWYEQIKFGAEFTDLNAVDGMAATDAQIMIVHSVDDTTVPTEYGYDLFHAAYGENDRFTFVLFEDRGHGYLFCSEEALAYQDSMAETYEKFVAEHGGRDTQELELEFMIRHLDKGRYFALDMELMADILSMYDLACAS